MSAVRASIRFFSCMTTFMIFSLGSMRKLPKIKYYLVKSKESHLIKMKKRTKFRNIYDLPYTRREPASINFRTSIMNSCMNSKPNIKILMFLMRKNKIIKLRSFLHLVHKEKTRKNYFKSKFVYVN